MINFHSVQLMEVFKVAPFDQNLMVNGEYLTDNHLTLGQLKVLPGSLIFLRVCFSVIHYEVSLNIVPRLTSQPTLLQVQVRTTWDIIIQRRDLKEQVCSVDKEGH